MLAGRMGCEPVVHCCRETTQISNNTRESAMAVQPTKCLKALPNGLSPQHWQEATRISQVLQCISLDKVMTSDDQGTVQGKQSQSFLHEDQRRVAR